MSAGQPRRCAEVALAEAPGMARGQSFANVVSVGLSCANDGEEPWAKELGAGLEALASEAVKAPGVLADDRAGLYDALVTARQKAGDAKGAKARSEEEWAFLVAERSAGKTPEARTMLDSWIVAAAMDLHDPGRAVPLLKESEKAAPTDYNPPYRLAVLYLELEKPDEALQASNRALALAYGPRKIRVLAQRATILEAKGDARGRTQGAAGGHHLRGDAAEGAAEPAPRPAARGAAREDELEPGARRSSPPGPPPTWRRTAPTRRGGRCRGAGSPRCRRRPASGPRRCR